MVALKPSAIDFAHYDVDAAKNYHYVGNGVAEAKILEDREINKARWPHSIPIRIRAAVTDEIESELAFGRFNAAVRFAHRRTKCAKLHLWIHDRPRLNLRECLLQDGQALVHFEHTQHQAIVSITMLA